MIEIDQVELTNFLSYGNYITKIELSKLGQCLITGEIIDDSGVSARGRSNGSGKSTITNAILWCLFGRTMHSANPGDKVINWQTGKDCVVSVKLKNGDVITRTRKTKDHDELIVEHGGEQILSTLSTSTSQQQALNKLYGLDWEIFCGSSFFTQYNKPWLEMQDQQRKNAIERITRLDRFTLYATVAKEKLVEVTADQGKLVSQRENILRMIGTIDTEIREAKLAESKFEKEREQRCRAALQQALDYKAKRDAITIPDSEQLKAKWELVEQINTKRREIEVEMRKFRLSIESKGREKRELSNKITTWGQKAGKICLECGQEVKKAHVHDKVMPLKDQITALDQEMNGLAEKAKTLEDQITKIDEKVMLCSPKQTLREIEALKIQYNNMNEAARKWAENAKAIKTEVNPHMATASRLREKLNGLNEEIKEIKETLQRTDILIDHINYIQHSYADRKKIKSFGTERYRPLFNERLTHYLEMFGLDLKLELSESLSINSDHWGYDFMSGGERKRADVSFMLAMFDLHEELYGRQSNIIVLDEVDGRLDDEGVDLLVNIVKSDLAARVETILIISHRNQMRDIFPHQIMVRRRNRFSTIDEVR